ncbi:type II secretion system F family protein [Dermabacteraceae bacterium CCM 9520]
MTPFIGSLIAAAFAAGIFLTIQGLTPAPVKEKSKKPHPKPNGLIPKLSLSLLLGALAWLLTGYFALLLVVPALAFIGPELIPKSNAKKTIQQLEATQEWAHSLSGLLGAGASLEQAIISSNKSAPAPIKKEVGLLAARLNAGIHINKALEMFSDDLNNETGDLLAGALIISSRRRGSGLIAVLDECANTIAEDVAIKRQIEADREKPRANARWITIIQITVLAAMFLFAPEYSAPYKTPIGQITLIALSATFIMALYLMNKMTKPKPGIRLLKTGK